MLLHHAIHYHEAQDWIQQHNQQEFTYSTVLFHCKLLKSWCKQYQKAKEKDCTNLNTITAVIHPSRHNSPRHPNPQCTKCGHNHLPGNCSAYGKTVIPAVIKAISQAYTEDPKYNRRWSCTHPNRYHRLYSRSSSRSGSRGIRQSFPTMIHRQQIKKPYTLLPRQHSHHKWDIAQEKCQIHTKSLTWNRWQMSNIHWWY